MGKRETVRLPHVDQSGRGLDDGECSYCGDSGNLESTECHVRLRQALDEATNLCRGAEADALAQTLRALLAAGTPGPWKPCGARDGACDCGLVWSGDGAVVVARTTQDDGDDVRLDNARVRANAHLIAAAVNALPALLDALDAGDREREALRAWVREALPVVGFVADYNDRMGRDADATFKRGLALRDGGSDNAR